MTTIIILAVVIIAAALVARMAFSAEGGGAPPPLPEEPSLSNPPHFVPTLQRQRAPTMVEPPTSILGLPTDGPPPRVAEDDEWTMYQRLIERVGDRARADRMIEHERVSWPMATRRDWIIRAEQKLDAQAQR